MFAGPGGEMEKQGSSGGPSQAAARADKAAGAQIIPPTQRAPLTVMDILTRRMIQLVRGEDSGLYPDRVIEGAARAALGDTIAPGFYVTYRRSTAHFHVLDVPIKKTLKNFGKVQDNLLRCIEEAQLIKGASPSTTALRVVATMLQQLPDISKASKSALNQLRKDAKEVDLKNPQDPNWNRSLKLEIAGKQFDVVVALKTVSLVSKALIPIIGKDIPAEERSNKYGFELTFEPSPPAVTDTVRRLRHLGMQSLACTCFFAPVFAVARASAYLLPKAILPTFTSVSVLQWFAESTVQMVPTVAAMALVYFASNVLEKRRHS